MQKKRIQCLVPISKPKNTLFVGSISCNLLSFCKQSGCGEPCQTTDARGNRLFILADLDVLFLRLPAWLVPLNWGMRKVVVGHCSAQRSFNDSSALVDLVGSQRRVGHETCRNIECAGRKGTWKFVVRYSFSIHRLVFNIRMCADDANYGMIVGTSPVQSVECLLAECAIARLCIYILGCKLGHVLCCTTISAVMVSRQFHKIRNSTHIYHSPHNYITSSAYFGVL
ncbi:hypothetical protein J3A83DRAFT_4301369 [Scleroderma citrinum]